MGLSLVDAYATRRIAGFCDESAICNLATIDRGTRRLLGPVCWGVAGSLRMARSLTTGQRSSARNELKACCGVPEAPAVKLLAFLRSTCCDCTHAWRFRCLLETIETRLPRSFRYQPHLAFEGRLSACGQRPGASTNVLVLDAWRRLAAALWPEAGGGARWNRWRSRGLAALAPARAHAGPKPIGLASARMPGTWTPPLVGHRWFSPRQPASATRMMHVVYRMPVSGTHSCQYWRLEAPTAMALIY